jgi:predicted Ser/Thr protein kinase
MKQNKMLKHIGEGGSAQVHLDVATGTCIKTGLNFANAPKNNFCAEAKIQIIAAKAGISPAVLSYSEEYIEMQYIESVTLDEYRLVNGHDALKQEQQKILDIQSSLDIVNEDAHLQNFLVDDQNKLWLIDFGRAYMRCV